MMYGKNTEWLKGIKVGEEPKRLRNDQLARGYELAQRISDKLDDILINSRQSIQMAIAQNDPINEMDFMRYNLAFSPEFDKIILGLEKGMDSRGINRLDLDPDPISAAQATKYALRTSPVGW